MLNGWLDNDKFKDMSEIENYHVVVECANFIRKCRQEKSSPFYLENIEKIKDKLDIPLKRVFDKKDWSHEEFNIQIRECYMYNDEKLFNVMNNK